MFLALFLSVFATSLGGIWFTYKKTRIYSEEGLSFLISITTGLLHGVLFTSFIPHSLELKSFYFFMLGGVFSILLVSIFFIPLLSKFGFKGNKEDHTTHHHYHHHLVDCMVSDRQRKKSPISAQTSCSIIGCLTVCCFFDGFELNVAFSIHEQAGWITGISLFFHTLPDGVLVSSLMLTSGFSTKMRYLVCLIPGFFLTLGFLLAFSLSFLSNWILGLIPFSTGILIYIVFTHLIPVALKTRRSFFWFFLGNLFSILLNFFVK